MPLRRSQSIAVFAAAIVAWTCVPVLAQPLDEALRGATDEAAQGEPEADERAWVYGEVGVVSDYVDRGISNSNRDPALQAGITFEFDLLLDNGSTAYIDVWGSSVDFDDDNEAQVELDLTLGAATPLGETGFDLDLAASYIFYPGADQSLDYDYAEFPLAIGYAATDDLTLGLGYAFSPNFSGSAGVSHYVEALAGWTVPWLPENWPLSLDLRLGRQWIESNSTAGIDDYFDWGVGVTLGLGPVDVGLHYTDTSLDDDDCYDGTDLCDARLVLSAVARF